MSDSQLVKNVKEAATLVVISAGIGYAVKKALNKAVTDNPATSLMNALEWTAVLTGAIYARDYLIKEKIIPELVRGSSRVRGNGRISRW